jgi:hypothetical protein
MAEKEVKVSSDTKKEKVVSYNPSKNENTYLIISLIIFILSILSCVFLYLNNASIDKKINDEENKIG